MNQIVDPLPTIVQAPRLFAGEIELRRRHPVVERVSSRCTTRWRSSEPSTTRSRVTGRRIIRLDGLVTANEEARELPTLTALPSGDGSLELDDVEVRTPDGVRLVDPLDVRLDPGDSLVITGSSGTGKTTLLRSLAQLWPFTSGTLRAAAGRDHVPVPASVRAAGRSARGDLISGRRGQVFRRAQIRSALDTVSLGHLGSRLDEVADWAKILSPGEQQRIAFARVLLAKPKVGVPRRVDVGAGRRSGVRTVPRAANPAAGQHRGQRQSSPHTRTAPRQTAGAARRR